MAKSNKPIPQFNYPIIETHCHLDYLEDESLDVIIDRAKQVGVERIMTIAVSKNNLQKAKSIANQHANVFFSQGIHPHDAADFDSDVEQTIRQNAADQKMLAVGEIGLDYYYNNCAASIQQQAFTQQMHIADELNLPVVIHSREACEDTQQILQQFSKSNARRGVIHSFTSSMKLAEYCLSEGYYLGFNGIITFNKAENVREVLKATPLSSILLETDAPYLTPVPYRGKSNQPCYLPFVAQKIAEVKQLDIEEVLQQCYENSLNLFFANDTQR